MHEQFFTDTTDYADIVLPATTFLEHKELMGAYGHYFAQISQPAIAPLGEARMNVQLFAELGRRMGFEEQAFRESEDDLIAQALESKHPWFEGITKERLEREGMAPLALPKNERGESLPFSTHEWFQTPDRRANLFPLPEWHAATESRANLDAAAKFPLEMLPRKGDNYMNTTFANLPNHRKMESRTEGVLEMRAADAAARGISTGDAVRVWNDRGQIQLTARISESIPAGTVASKLDWQKLSHGGVNVNELTSQRLTDIGGGATFYSTLVEVKKAGIAFSRIKSSLHKFELSVSILREDFARVKICVKWSLAVSALMMGVFSAAAQETPQKTTTTTTATMSSEPEKKSTPLPPDSFSEGSVSVEGGKTIAFRTVAGMLTVGSTDSQDARIGLDGKQLPDAGVELPAKPEDRPATARIFYTAHFAKDADQRTRPIVFLYNGGPGSATMYLRMTSMGPVRVQLPDLQHPAGGPYQIASNPYCLLDAADLVFIDAPGHRLQPCRGQGRLQSVLRHRWRRSGLRSLHPPFSDEVQPLELAQVPLR